MFGSLKGRVITGDMQAPFRDRASVPLAVAWRAARQE
jgi:hypothetical protein